MNENSVISQTIGILLETMRKASSGEITTQMATAIAVNGRTVIDAAKAETEFIKTVRAIPQGGVWGKEVTYLEPNVEIDEETKKRKPKQIDIKKSEDEFGGPSAKEWH